MSLCLFFVVDSLTLELSASLSPLSCSLTVLLAHSLQPFRHNETSSSCGNGLPEKGAHAQDRSHPR